MSTVKGPNATEGNDVKELDNQAGAAAYLEVKERTLEDWRYHGRGPAYVRVQGSIRYRKMDVDQWLAANTVEPRKGAA